VEITKGLNPGDKVIASGQNRLQNKAPVQIIATKPDVPKPAPVTEPAQ
jgi:hypothetical protein